MQSKVVDIKVSDASDQFLELNLLACNSNELGQRFLSRSLHPKALANQPVG